MDYRSNEKLILQWALKLSENPYHLLHQHIHHGSQKIVFFDGLNSYLVCLYLSWLIFYYMGTPNLEDGVAEVLKREHKNLSVDKNRESGILWEKENKRL